MHTKTEQELQHKPLIYSSTTTPLQTNNTQRSSHIHTVHTLLGSGIAQHKTKLLRAQGNGANSMVYGKPNVSMGPTFSTSSSVYRVKRFAMLACHVDALLALLPPLMYICEHAGAGTVYSTLLLLLLLLGLLYFIHSHHHYHHQQHVIVIALSANHQKPDAISYIVVYNVPNRLCDV